MKYIKLIGFYLLLALSFSSCKVYKQNIILKSDEDLNSNAFSESYTAAQEAYRIQPNDRLRVEVFTDQGERIIDPFGMISDQNGGAAQFRPENFFVVFPDGSLNLPFIGETKLNKNETVKSLQIRLSDAYQAFFIAPFVRVSVLNRRVTVLGALGGQVIPLENENMNLLEVLALAGGLNNDAKGTNIRLIRGPLDAPAVQLIDLSTIDGMQKASLNVMPGDVIYIEPIRRVFNEGFRDAAPIIGVITNLITIIVVTQNLF